MDTNFDSKRVQGYAITGLALLLAVVEALMVKYIDATIVPDWLLAGAWFTGAGMIGIGHADAVRKRVTGESNGS